MAAIHNVLAGSGSRIPVTITLASNQTNYVLSTAQVPGYVPGSTDVTLVINSGIFVSSNNTGTPALDVNTSFNAQDTISIVNNGTIVGMGGRGSNADAANAGVGGLALRVQRSTTINNTGTIAGGGGGGGGGNTFEQLVQQEFGSDGSNSTWVTFNGGGGGGGRSSAAANSVGGTPGGTAGTVSAAGLGAGASRGGDGGNWGAAGQNAGASSGAAGGAAVNGNSNITWVATGTRLGAIA